jgi:O-methyltransferase
MQTKLFFIRKTKALFTRFKLHKVIEPFSGFLMNLTYMSKMSKWVNENKELTYNDFYSSKWDYSKRLGLYDYVDMHYIKDEPINYLEFGVSAGGSFLWWLNKHKNVKSQFHGFDTFTGLPEDYGPFKKGAMSTSDKLPDTNNDPRVKFHIGLFQQTLPGFLKSFANDRRNVIHLDADIYSATLYAMCNLAPFLKKGDLILFDEFFVPTHEFLAFKNFTESYYLQLKPIAAANNYLFMAFEVQ